MPAIIGFVKKNLTTGRCSSGCCCRTWRLSSLGLPRVERGFSSELLMSLLWKGAASSRAPLGSLLRHPERVRRELASGARVEGPLLRRARVPPLKGAWIVVFAYPALRGPYGARSCWANFIASAKRTRVFTTVCRKTYATPSRAPANVHAVREPFGAEFSWIIQAKRLLHPGEQSGRVFMRAPGVFDSAIPVSVRPQIGIHCYNRRAATVGVVQW